VIRGFFREEDQLPRVAVGLELERLPGLALVQFDVNFVVDTASTDTCIHPRDAGLPDRIPIRTLMDAGLWRAQRQHAGIGGDATYFMAACTYVFHHEDGSEQRLQATIDIAQPTLANFGVPSVLGWDVLQHFAMRFDWSQRLVELA